MSQAASLLLVSPPREATVHPHARVRPSELAGRRALITGASSGLGADFARLLAAHGCSLVLVARRADRLEALARELAGQHGVAVDPIALDLCAEGACHALCTRLRGPVDVLVNNAGVGAYGAFLETPWERLERMIRLDVVVPTELTRRLAPEMQARGFGLVLQVASIAAFQPAPLYAAYGAAKSYVLSLSEALDHELAGSGVSSTVLCPGVTRTEFFDTAAQPELTLYQRLMMMDSATVARIGLDALLRRRRSVVPGWLNALASWIAQRVPRRLATRLAHWMMRA